MAGGRSPSFGSQHSFPRPLVPQRPFFHPRPFFPHHFRRHFFGGFNSFGGFDSFPLVTSSVFAYAPPAYDSSAAYGSPPAIYNVYNPAVEVYNAPPGGYNPPADGSVSVPPPAPTVVEYATGRYELRGDGMTAPYSWVWIPNPPPGPPGAPPTGGPASGEPSTSRHGQIYRWTDDQGVMHMTDRWDAVPPQYRTQAKPKQPS